VILESIKPIANPTSNKLLFSIINQGINNRQLALFTSLTPRALGLMSSSEVYLVTISIIFHKMVISRFNQAYLEVTVVVKMDSKNGKVFDSSIFCNYKFTSSFLFLLKIGTLYLYSTTSN